VDDNAVAGVQAQAGAFAGGLGGEEGLEDAVLELARDAGAVVGQLDDDEVGLAAGGDGDFGLAGGDLNMTRAARAPTQRFGFSGPAWRGAPTLTLTLLSGHGAP